MTEATNPYNPGAGRYPNRFYNKFEIEFALVFCFSYTELIIIPVNGGTIKPPKNNKNHNKIPVA